MATEREEKDFGIMRGYGGCLVIFIAVVCLLIGGSLFFGREIPLPPERIDNISRVFMHTPGNYSFLVKGSNHELISYVPRNPVGTTKLIEDVPEEKSMWAIMTRNRSLGAINIISLEIHIHSAREIEGGGWNQGKIGSGQTEVIN